MANKTMNKTNKAYYLYVKYNVEAITFLTIFLAIVIGLGLSGGFRNIQAESLMSNTVLKHVDSSYAAEPPSDGLVPEQTETVDVDVSSVLQVGDMYEVRNAQNYFGPIVLTGIYDGSPISLPMTGLEPAQPIGPGLIEPSEFTGSEFNVFVIRTIEGDPTGIELESVTTDDVSPRLFFGIIAAVLVVFAITLKLIIGARR